MQLVTWVDLTRLKVRGTLQKYPDMRLESLFHKGLSMTVNVLGAVTDVVIAAGLFFFLHRSRTGFKK